MAKTFGLSDIPELLTIAGITPPRWAVNAVNDAAIRYNPAPPDDLATRVLTAKSQGELDRAGEAYSVALANLAFSSQVNQLAEQRSRDVLAAAYTPDRMAAVVELVASRYVEVASPFVAAARGVSDVTDVSAADITTELVSQRDALAATVEPLRGVRSVWVEIARLAELDLEPSVSADLGSELLSIATFPTYADLTSAADTVSRHRQIPGAYLFSAFTPELAVIFHGGTFRLTDGEGIDTDRIALYRESQ